MEAALRAGLAVVARYGAAAVVLGAELLSGQRAATSALVAALLWAGMVLGELRVLSQASRGGAGRAKRGRLHPLRVHGVPPATACP